ncbi:hypothetical protein DL767_011344 [Monosporascus sp. MG133]|nr:hypothetical protein DL767_011344 [Monosporascus sp. MG133]
MATIPAKVAAGLHQWINSAQTQMKAYISEGSSAQSCKAADDFKVAKRKAENLMHKANSPGKGAGGEKPRRRQMISKLPSAKQESQPREQRSTTSRRLSIPALTRRSEPCGVTSGRAVPKVTPTTYKGGKSRTGKGEYDVEKTANPRLNKRRGIHVARPNVPRRTKTRAAASSSRFPVNNPLPINIHPRSTCGRLFRLEDAKVDGSRSLWFLRNTAASWTSTRSLSYQQHPPPVNNIPLFGRQDSLLCLSFIRGPRRGWRPGCSARCPHRVSTLTLLRNSLTGILDGGAEGCLWGTWRGETAQAAYLVIQRMGRTRSRLRCGVVRIQASEGAAANDDQEAPAGPATRGRQAAPKKPVTRSTSGVAGASSLKRKRGVELALVPDRFELQQRQPKPPWPCGIAGKIPPTHTADPYSRPKKPHSANEKEHKGSRC